MAGGDNKKQNMKKIYTILFLAICWMGTNVASAQLADSSWPMFHGDGKLTGQSKYDTSKVDGTIKWVFKTEDQIETSPVIGEDGTIYIADQNCNLYALTSEGKEKWKIKLGEATTSKEWGHHSCFQSSPAVAKDGTIYAFPMSHNFYAINPDGTIKWKYPLFTFKNDWSSPNITKDGTIYVGSELYPPHETGKPEEETAKIYAFNPDGTVKWSYDTRGVWVTSTSSVADDGTMYTSANDCVENNCANTIFAFTPEGNIKWKFAISDGVNEGSAAVGKDGTVYFTAKGERNPRINAFFYALTPEGEEKWKFSAPEGISMTPGLSDDGKIYFGDWGGTFYALDLNGKLLWKVETPDAYETLSSSPAIGKEGTVYFGTLAHYFYAYNPDGTKKWEISLEEGGVNSSPAIGQDGTVYFASVPGKLYAIGTKNDAGKYSATESGSTLQSADVDKFSIKIAFTIGLVVFLSVLFIIIILKHQKKTKSAYYLSAGITVMAIVVCLLLAMTNQESADGERVNNNQPVFGDNKSSNHKNRDVEIKETDCPHHVYGTTETGWYAAYGMQTKDLNNKEVEWIRTNCPNATFQAEVK